MARICEIVSTPLPPEEGISNYALNLSKELAERGNDVTILTRGSAWSNRASDCDGLSVIATRFLPLYPFHVDLHARLIEKVLREDGDFDLIHCHSPLTLPPRGTWPVVSTFHTPMATDIAHLELVDWKSSLAKLMKPFSIRVERKLMRDSDIVSAVSLQTKKELLDYGLEADEVEVFWNGVNTDVFEPPVVPSTSRIILYVGRLSYRKGLVDLVKCAKIVLQRFPDWAFTVVGSGPLASALGRATRNLKIPPSKFRLRGFLTRDQVVAEYQRAQLFILPSRYEGLPTTLLEALSSGLPVIATTVGGVSDVVEDGKTGLLCPPGNPEVLAARIIEAILDDNLRRRLSQNGRSLVEKRFDWRTIAKSFLDTVRHEFPEAVS